MYLIVSLERVGGEWRTTAKDRRSWRQLTEGRERKVRRGKKTKKKTWVTMADLTPTTGMSKA